MTSKTIVVTGANGCIGGAIVKALAATNHRVVRMVRCQLPNSHGNVEWRGYDGLFPKCDTVVHCAGLGSPVASVKELYESNVVLSREIVEQANHAGVSRFIHLSTAAVQSENQGSYVKSKRLSEFHVTGAFLRDACFVRPVVVLGAGDTKNYATLVRKINRGLQWCLPGESSFVDPSDVAKHVVGLIDADATPYATYLRGPVISWEAVFTCIARNLGLPTRFGVATPFHLTVMAMIERMKFWRRPEITREVIDLLATPATTLTPPGVTAIDMPFDMEKSCGDLVSFCRANALL